MVFCSKFSITRAEFNAAGQLGHKPDIMLLVDSDAYDQEKILSTIRKNIAFIKPFNDSMDSQNFIVR